jgi:hypothetical protein
MNSTQMSNEPQLPCNLAGLAPRVAAINLCGGFGSAHRLAPTCYAVGGERSRNRLVGAGLLLAQADMAMTECSRGGVCPREWRQDDLRAVTKKCRTDWDITTPTLNEAWQQGRKELFYPYGKTYVHTLGEQI